ncbi:MAG: hypothetical protein KME26_12870 [Oscillatoria princeps RMCB-10]|jgi:hypothetical protein|nr:hypothetical protein [Oscillatoria princeps RMCB-10]
MKFTLSVFPWRITKALTGAVLFFTSAGIAVQFAKYRLNYRAEWLKLFNLDRELNYPSWYASFTLAFCSLLLAAIASAKKRDGDRYFRHWKNLSLIFLFLSVDEAMSIHELLISRELRHLLHAGGIFYYIWVIPATIFVAVVGLSYLKFLIHLPQQIRLLFMVAGGVYVGGALGMEMVSGYWTDFYGKNNLNYALITSAEECLEMAGVAVFIHALLSYMRLYMKDLELRFQFTDGTKPQHEMDSLIAGDRHPQDTKN